MILQNHIDDAIISERNNEQDLFHGNSNSQDIYSDNSNDSEEEIGNDDLQQKEILRYNDQSIITKSNNDINKEDKKKKELKASCLGKAKGYMGFGNQLNNQKIGNIFFIPIPSSWTFRCQVITTLLINTFLAFSIFVSFSNSYLTSNQSMMREWLDDNFDELQGKLLQEIDNGLQTLLNETIKEDLTIISQSSKIISLQTMLPLVNLTWPTQKTISIDEQIPQIYLNQTREEESYYSQISYEFATYYKDQSLNQTKINQYMNINYLLNSLYQNKLGISDSIYWKFNNEFIMVYPGVIVKNVSNFVNTVNSNFDMFLSQLNSNNNIISTPVKNNLLNNKQCAYVATLLQSEDGLSNLGIAYTEISIAKIQSLYIKAIGGINETMKFIMLDVENNILNDAFEQIGTKFKDQKILNISAQTQEQILQFISKDNVTYFKFTSLDGKAYTQQSFIYQRLGIKFIIILDNFKLFDRQNTLDQQFLDFRANFRYDYLPYIIGVPCLFMMISVFFLVRFIRPIQQITKIAYLSLKKNQKLNQEELDQINGNGLINQLIILFKTLIVSLNAMKQDNKKHICNYYSQQTYPKKTNVKDLQKIKAQIEEIKQLSGTENSIGTFQNKRERHFKLLPGYDE